MKPNFALNLSHEGISLLHRAKGGWLSIGDVLLDDTSLVEQLDHMRRNAADLDTGGLTTKLVIPGSQILYTEVDAPGPDTADRIAQIRDALVGLTPYDVRDLVFDWRLKGNRAQVAVVARETLHEAEAFAVQYRFNPVSFVGSPNNAAFDGEPFFGPTRHAASLLTGGETVQPDRDSIHILRPGETGPVEAAPPAKPKPKPKSRTKPEPEPAAASPAFRSKPKPEPEEARPKLSFGRRRAEPAVATPPPDASPAPPPEPAVTFASRRANGQSTAIPKPKLTVRAEIAPLPAPKPAAARPAANPAPSPAAAPTPPPRGAPIPPRRTPMPVTAPGAADPQKPTPRKKAAGTAKSAGAALAGTLGKLRRSAQKPQAKSAFVPPPEQAPTPTDPPHGKTPPPIPDLPQPTKRSAATEADAMTVFGARGRQPTRGKPRYLGLILTLILLLALAILALWSTYFMSDMTSGWFGTFEDEPEISAAAPAPGIATVAPPTARIEPTPINPGAVETPAPAADAETPGADTAETAQPPATGDQPVPDLASAPPDQPGIAAALQEALTGAPAAETAETPGADTSETLALATPPEADIPATPEPEPTPIIRRPLTRAEAEARYASTGIWQLDPDPLADPGSDRTEGLVTASTDPRLTEPAETRLPPESVIDTDQRPETLLPPAPLGSSFDFDDRGVVRATTDGALTPSGVQVFRGPPAYVPGLRPADLPVPQDETSLDSGQIQTAAPAAPATTPDDGQAATVAAADAETVAEAETELASLGGFSPDDLAGVRPAVRPASLWSDPGADAAPDTETATTPDDDADAPDPELDDATRLAVAASSLPAVRPQNFSSLVERALEEASTADAPNAPQQETQVAVAAPRTPSIPTRASVAKQATEANAINLSKVNLIGVYGTPSNRSALVRLKSGRFVKVGIGDTVDGGRVAAIGDDELRYVKRGRNITLKMPKG